MVAAPRRRQAGAPAAFKNTVVSYSYMALGVAHVGHVLEVGTLVTSGPAKQLAADDAIRKAYLGVH